MQKASVRASGQRNKLVQSFTKISQNQLDELTRNQVPHPARHQHRLSHRSQPQCPMQLYPTGSDRHETLTAAIGYFLAKYMNTINTVEGQGFNKTVLAFDKRYGLPSGHHFSRTFLPHLYRQCCEEVTKP